MGKVPSLTALAATALSAMSVEPRSNEISFQASSTAIGAARAIAGHVTLPPWVSYDTDLVQSEKLIVGVVGSWSRHEPAAWQPATYGVSKTSD